jgi:hypothetical protein
MFELLEWMVKDLYWLYLFINPNAHELLTNKPSLCYIQIKIKIIKNKLEKP